MTSKILYILIWLSLATLSMPGKTHEDTEDAKCATFIVNTNLSKSITLDSNQGTFQECWYAGGSLGASYLSPKGSSNGWSSSDGNSIGTSVFAGRDIRENWGIELSYSYMGKAELRNSDANINSRFDAELQFQATSLVLIHRFFEESSTFNIYVKGGASLLRTSQTHTSVGYGRQTNLRPSLGAGLLYRLPNNPWFVRLDIQSSDDTSLYNSIQIGRYFGYKTTYSRSRNIKYTSPENIILEQDSDGDKVRDEFDHCPHSAPGVEVNSLGCCTEKEGCTQIQ